MSQNSTMATGYLDRHYLKVDTLMVKPRLPSKIGLVLLGGEKNASWLEIPKNKQLKFHWLSWMANLPDSW